MELLKKKWVVPAAALILTLSIGGAAFAATGVRPRPPQLQARGRSGRAPEPWRAATRRRDPADRRHPGQGPGGGACQDRQRCEDIRAETDADGNAKYEVHAIKADGTRVVVYVDASYNVVKVETCAGPARSDDGSSPVAWAVGWVAQRATRRR